jgi:hypothetical protein
MRREPAKCERAAPRRRATFGPAGRTPAGARHHAGSLSQSEGRSLRGQEQEPWRDGGKPAVRASIDQAKYPSGEGQGQDRKGKHYSLGKEGDHASVIVVREPLGGLGARMVRGARDERGVPMQTLMKLRTGSQDGEHQHQDRRK